MDYVHKNHWPIVSKLRRLYQTKDWHTRLMLTDVEIWETYWYYCNLFPDTIDFPEIENNILETIKTKSLEMEVKERGTP